MNKDIEQVIKAFQAARIEGAKLLEAGKITWDDYAFTMLGFEAQLKAMGQAI